MHRNLLTQRVEWFRFAAYLWLSVVLCLMARDANPPQTVWLFAALAPVLPLLARAGRRTFGGAVDDAENLFTPFIVAAFGLPPLPNVATIGALLTGAVAQFGWRGLSRCGVFVVAGWCAGALVVPRIVYQPSALVDALCLAFMVAYTTPLCALGYEETMRMHRMRERLRAVSGELELQRDRLSRYVAAPVAARSTKAPLERRWLTVAFIDISDFTALTERLEPEDLTSLLDGFFAALVELAARYKGNLHKFLGDGALISFGDASSEGRKADARACVAMLGQLVGLIDRLNEAATQRGTPAVLAVRAGVASGYCSVGDFGADERIEYTMIGAAVNLASRLEGLAAIGETWASQATRDLVGGEHFEPVGPLAVKGVAEPVMAFRLCAKQTKTHSGSHSGTGSVDVREAAN
jgi:class 3 adenylate cyclase